MGEKEIPEEIIGWFRLFRDHRRWQTAKSGPPHQYTIRDWKPDYTENFKKAVQIIYDYGVPEKFYAKTFYYLYLDGLKYWTMNEAPEITVVLNRAEDHTFYGKQD